MLENGLGVKKRRYERLVNKKRAHKLTNIFRRRLCYMLHDGYLPFYLNFPIFQHLTKFDSRCDLLLTPPGFD